jgi:Arc/MetJ-type ribon-helix-helix transcriptional regulator
MTVQITVRLPDDLVEFIDEQVHRGEASSRASAVANALASQRRHRVALQDAAILASHRAADPDDFDDLATWAAIRPIDID